VPCEGLPISASTNGKVMAAIAAMAAGISLAISRTLLHIVG